MDLLLILLLILLNGLFAMAELAIVSARQSRLQGFADEGNHRAVVALDLSQDPNRFLATVQVGITLIGIMAGAIGGAAFSDDVTQALEAIRVLAPYASTLSLVFIVLITSYLSLVFGELVPKRLALMHPERVALVVALPMRWLSAVALPLVWLLTVSTDFFLTLLGIREQNTPPVSEADVVSLVRTGTETGAFHEAEQSMVERVLYLDAVRVDAVMTPRTEMIWLDLQDGWEANLEKVLESPYSRFPVCMGDLEHLEGIVRERDIIQADRLASAPDLRDILSAPLIVPESLRLLHALQRFQQTQHTMAMVITEFGGIVGLLTVNDIVDQIIEGIEVDSPTASQRADGSWLVDGLLPIHEFKSLLEIDELPDEEHYRTVGGLVITLMGRIPRATDVVNVVPLQLEVVDMDGQRVDKVMVKHLE